MIKMIVFDMDGTILNNEGNLSNNTIEYLKLLKNEGYIIIFASGRPFMSLLKSANLLDFDFPLISENGAYLSTPSCDIEKSFASICINDFLNIFKFSKEHIVSSFYSVKNEIFIYNRLDKLETFYNITESTVVHNGPFDNIDNLKEPNGVIFIVKTEFKDLFENYIKTNFYDRLNLRCAGFDIKNAVYELSSSSSNKSIAVNFLLDHYNLLNEQMICFGDGENDIDMLKMSINSVAMKNASDNVKSCSNFITDFTNDEDGAILFLKKFL
ncbi:MAG: HAD-IIB family hydrolase [Anaeroplasmataceae bacterium]